MGRKRLPVVLEADELERLLAEPNTGCPSGLRNRAIMEVLGRAGLRNAEARHLRPSHIRWSDGLLEVRCGKGGRDRNVPFDEETRGWLRAWSSERPDGPWFFGTLDGGKLSGRYLQAMVKRLARRALGDERGDDVTPHVLRHTYATNKLDEGLTIREVQHLLGHADVSTTQIYTHVRPGNLREKIQGGDGEAEADGEARRLAEALQELPDETRAALADMLEA